MYGGGGLRTRGIHTHQFMKRIENKRRKKGGGEGLVETREIDKNNLFRFVGGVAIVDVCVVVYSFDDTS